VFCNLVTKALQLGTGRCIKRCFRTDAPGLRSVGRTGSATTSRSSVGNRRRASPAEYSRGTTSLFAALEVATGTVTDACYQRHTHAEFVD
jgi:hypothetical protein